jgi:hypothetical protein
MLKAWRFKAPPRLLEVLAKQLTFEATVRAVLLDDVDARAVLALEKEEVPVRDYPAVRKLRELREALPRTATTGPRPVSWSGESSLSRDLARPVATVVGLGDALHGVLLARIIHRPLVRK